MISRAGQWTHTHLCHPSPAKKIKFLFLDYVQLLMIGHGLVNRLEPCLPPLSSQKNEMLVFGLCSTSDDWPGCSMDLNPICHPSPAKKLNAHFWIMFNFWWSAGLVNGLKPHLPPLSSQKKIKCLFLDYVQLLMISWAGQWTLTPSATLLQPIKNKMLIFGLHSTSGERPGWSNVLESHLPPLSSQKN